jgi:hypothetical protein
LYVSIVKLAARSAVRLAALMLAFSIVSFQGTSPLDLARTVVAIWPYLIVFGITGLRAFHVDTGVVNDLTWNVPSAPS